MVNVDIQELARLLVDLIKPPQPQPRVVRNLPPPEQFDPQRGDIFEFWQNRYDRYRYLMGLDEESEETQVKEYLATMGGVGRKLYSRLGWAGKSLEEVNSEEIGNWFKIYFGCAVKEIKPKLNTMVNHELHKVKCVRVNFHGCHGRKPKFKIAGGRMERMCYTDYYFYCFRERGRCSDMYPTQ
jgi:hypothetical protein